MFEGAKLKAEWATHMIRQIEMAVQRYSANQRSEIRSNHNSERGELRVQIRGVPAPVRPDVVMLAGTAVQTLRSCLDFITSDIWNTAKQTDTRIHFPIDVDQAQLKASGSYAKIQKLDAGLADLIANDIKPTKAENYPLWALNRLANTDKHRNLLFVARWIGFEIDKIERPDGLSMRKTRFLARTGQNDQDYLQIPDVKEYSEPYAVVQISFSEAGVVRHDVFDGFEIVQTLSGFHRAVVDTIEAVERYVSK